MRHFLALALLLVVALSGMQTAAAFEVVTAPEDVNAVNLTNQKDTQFWGQNRYLYNQNQSGSTYMLGLSYKF